MNRIRKQVWLAVGAVIILILLLLFWPRSNAPLAGNQPLGSPTNEQASIQSPVKTARIETRGVPQTYPTSPVSNTAQRQAEEAEKKELWRTPIVFFGKVVDENNQPITGVHIDYGANTLDETLTSEARNEGSTTSDTTGLFKISGIRGRSFVLELSRLGYYNSVSNPPAFDYADELKIGNSVPDTKERAMLFHMHSKGNPVALIERSGGLHAPPDGTTMDFPLRGKTRSEIICHLQAQAWKGASDPQSGRYDWRIKISLPEGGILESTSEFDFVAPASGYERSMEISVSKDDPDWKTMMRRKFFFKLPNYFMRGEVNIDVYHDLYFSMKYFVNPDGSSNLENDPSRPFSEP